ncbi:uncharacterized protein IL334_006174 [Kwoniella shivajii]|uniref:Roadblock/LAMTOR2 domain-containing protein n=1 Tax=Kwoniella shivajii TaxID=564305 RepID=A0ABZ1D567_9TREE|nr:hypothetical protein IL334_006174 [Kwoniella shivajii]
MSLEQSTSQTLPSSQSLHTLSLDNVQSPPPPEIESTLSRLSSYRNVKGVMILSRTPSGASSSTAAPSPGTVTNASGGIVQATGNIFEGESGKKYAKAVEEIVLRVGKALGECDESDDLKFMRIRTKKHELIITPDEKYLLVVLQDPGQ